MAPFVVGLDLSITATGIAWRDGTSTVVRGKHKDDRRLLDIQWAVKRACAQADLVVIEDLPTHAHGAGVTGMVHGAVRAVLLAFEITYCLVTPATLKKYATGKGNATKADMRMSLFQRTQVDVRDDNEVDARWLRHAGLDALGHPEIQLPATHRCALDRVPWHGLRNEAA